MQPTPIAAEAPRAGGAAGEALLSVSDLRVSYFLDEGTVRAVDNVSFDVYPGQVVGIVGESGCGKSVTMKAILRIVEDAGRIESGKILFRRAGHSSLPASDAVVDLALLSARSPEMRAIRGAEIALIPQEPMSAFSPVHTVGDQIVEAIRLHWRQWRPNGPSLTRAEARQITLDLFRDVGISMPEQRLDAYSWQLSGGLRQRAMIAMALSCKPRLLIADEPTTAIDVTTQAQVLELLRAMQKKLQTAVIFITHDLGVIAQIANYVVVMYLGRVMEQGPVEEIFHSPKHPYTRALLRSIPSLHGERRVSLPIISGTLPHPFNRPTGCPFHPRCEAVLPDRCAARVPALRPVGGRQEASCFLYHDSEDTA
jgi:oligopeptide/dipeptide ABC transporter ATP-binding protein